MDCTVPHSMTQAHEDDPADQIMLQEPDDACFFASLHPAANLFEKPLDETKARQQHQNFRNELQARKIRCVSVIETLQGTPREELEQLAMKSLEYRWNKCAIDTLSEEMKSLASEGYKKKVLQAMDVKSLVKVILLQPVVELYRSDINTGVYATQEVRPLGNIIFTRDQQIVTREGIVLANMNAIQRKEEVDVLELCWKQLGFPIKGRVPDPGKLEGGDFVPAGKELCFLGTGLRTNEEAVQYLLKNDLFGTDRVAVVRDMFDRNQDRMHLDVVFCIVGRKQVMVQESIIGKDNPHRRLVTEYQRQKGGGYALTSTRDVELSEYLVARGFEIIQIPQKYDCQYALNALNLGNSRIVTSHPKLAELLKKRLPHAEIIYIEYDGVTAMYGGLHCSTQVFRREVEHDEKETQQPSG